MTLLYPAWLIAAALALALFALLRQSAGRDDWGRVLSRDVQQFLTRADASGRSRDLALLALAVAFVALASPSIRAPSQSYVPAQGLVVLVDTSRSMTLGDIRPNRLSAARTAAMALAASAGAKPVALILYAGDAFVAQPFSRDRSQLNSFIGKIEHGLIGSEGSDLGRALSLTQSVLRQSGMTSSRIILISDAGGVSVEATELAGQLRKAGGRLDAILMTGPAADTPDKPDVPGLARLAEAGGGIVLRPDGFGVVDIDRLDLGNWTGSQTYSALNIPTTDWRNQSHWLLLACAPLFLLLFRRRPAQ